jgi:hypothetical protein
MWTWINQLRSWASQQLAPKVEVEDEFEYEDEVDELEENEFDFTDLLQDSTGYVVLCVNKEGRIDCELSLLPEYSEDYARMLVLLNTGAMFQQQIDLVKSFINEEEFEVFSKKTAELMSETMANILEEGPVVEPVTFLKRSS